MIKNKKIIIGILLLVIVVIVTIVLIPKGKKYKNTIFLGSVAKVKVVDNSIKVSYEDVKIRKQKAKIIYENDIVDGYIVSKEEPSSDQENTINAYNKDKEFLFCEPTLLAFTPDLDINYIKIDYQFYDDINTVYNYIYKENIDLATTKLDYFVKSTFDFDKDGVEEYIYSMGLIRSESRYDSLVVMFKDNKYYIINEKIGTYSEDSTKLELIGIMDINNDGNYEFIISKIDGEYSNIYYDIYNFKGSSFNKISID